jgi:hypothetical protein
MTLANKPPLQTPASVNPVAGARVAPPSGTAGQMMLSKPGLEGPRNIARGLTKWVHFAAFGRIRSFGKKSRK